MTARLLHHAVIDHIELIVEENFTVYLADDVVLYEDETINLDMDSEAICVEACANLLIDLDENVVRGFLDRALTILL